MWDVELMSLDANRAIYIRLKPQHLVPYRKKRKKKKEEPPTIRFLFEIWLTDKNSCLRYFIFILI